MPRLRVLSRRLLAVPMVKGLRAKIVRRGLFVQVGSGRGLCEATGRKVSFLETSFGAPRLQKSVVRGGTRQPVAQRAGKGMGPVPRLALAAFLVSSLPPMDAVLARRAPPFSCLYGRCCIFWLASLGLVH